MKGFIFGACLTALACSACLNVALLSGRYELTIHPGETQSAAPAPDSAAPPPMPVKAALPAQGYTQAQIDQVTDITTHTPAPPPAKAHKRKHG